MDDDVIWDNLSSELLVLVARKLSSCQDLYRFSAVSKSWKSVFSGMSLDEKPLLPPESPILFLAEQVAEGAILSCEFEDEDEDDQDEAEDSVDEDEDEDDQDENEDEDDQHEDEAEDDQHEDKDNRYDYRKNSVGNTRGLYSLSTRKTYFIEIPEASGKLILGTNKGWLFTLGRDLQINLLHPLLRCQISLPPMNTFPIQYKYCSPEKVTYMFIQKVVMSSKVQANKNVVLDKGTPNAIVFTIYGECGYLAFARLGDKVWTNVNIDQSPSFDDIAYYNGIFYAVNCQGGVFVCHIGDDYKRGGETRAIEIALCPLKPNKNFDQRYLVESGSGLWLIVRIRKVSFKDRAKYCTTHFLVWKLELKYSDDHPKIPSCTCAKMNSLGEEAFFIGRTSSVSLQSSKYIKPNSIYFTDDMSEIYNCKGGGHDMGIFNMESGIIEPFFQGKSIHPISPPLWYI